MWVLLQLSEKGRREAVLGWSREHTQCTHPGTGTNSLPGQSLSLVACSSVKHRRCCTHNIWRAGEGLWWQLEQEGQDCIEEALAHHQEQEPVHQRRQSRGG